MTQHALADQIPALRRYARALTGNTWAADDLVQDTLERACTKWRLWLVGSDLRAWLFTLMHNLYVTQIRYQVRQGELGQPLSLDDVDIPEMQPTPVDAAIDLQRCLLQLPEDQRAVLLLVTLEDLSYEEVARITGVPVGTVMSRLSRARHRLQDLMNAHPMIRSTIEPAQRPGANLRRLK